MSGPVRITVHYDERLRPTGRGRENRQKRTAYDSELERLTPRIVMAVQDRLNEVEMGAEVAAKTRVEDVTVDQQPYVTGRQAGTLFIEIRLDSAGPYRAASDELRMQIAADVLSWLGYWPRTANFLEVNLVFAEMSGVRVMFDKRELRNSWGERSEPHVGSQVPSM